MSISIDEPHRLLHLARVLQFGDSVLPVGAFSFSCGVESAIQVGLVHDVVTLKTFVETSLNQAAHCDAIGLAHAHRALLDGNFDQILVVDREIINRKLNDESRVMTQRMGKKLVEMTIKVFESELLERWVDKIKGGETAGTFPVSQALIMGLQGVNAQETVAMHQYGVAMTILSAAQRLMRITHFDSQRILFEVNKSIPEFCQQAVNADISEMASYTPLIDILAAVHVDAHVRLFMN
ncbi:urease accessory protein UreF [Serratia sp. UGAL515B_01]|uniref:urease accessory protein UreF n=1 Tax=Serratia sp. UGAL515B_01 TaxID=2986763 RepID=UPI002953CBE2|nr:urease accessory protein UreF [Serratia sp. UGAL515B_01]WON76276.1 urease accessory protein UreF [Serratia sp. UGAL515B_01]